MRGKTKSFLRAPIAVWVSYCVLSGLSITNATAQNGLLSFEPVTPRTAAGHAPAASSEKLLSFSASPSAAPTRPDAVLQPVAQQRRALVPATPKSLNTTRRVAQPARHASSEVLSFTATTAPAATPPPAPRATAPALPVSRAREEQAPYSVSAVALSALPPRLAARTASGRAALGPSEAELLQVFNRAVEAAVSRSPLILRARAEEQAAGSDVDEAKGQRWPQVDIGTQTQAKQFGKGSENQPSTGGVNLAVTTMLYDWGRIRNSIDSRELLSDAAKDSLEAEKENVGFEVVNTLIELGKQRIIVDLSQQFADRMEELVKMLAGIVAVDPGRSSELTQAKARLLQALALREAANAQARDAEITLTKLVGERPIPIPRAKEWNIHVANLDQLLDDASEHPTIRQANSEAESAELQAKAVRASGLPQLNWVISKNTAEDSIGREQPWQTNLSMTWGAFRGGSTRAAERSALSRADASRQQTAQQRLDLEFRIRSADHDARTQLERSELYRDLSVESGRIREDFYLQWHHLGKRTLLDVLTAENEHYGNQVSEITNRFNGYQAISRQYASAGTLARWLRSGS